MNRKALGAILLFCLIAPISATFLFLQIQKKQVKREVKWKFIAEMNHNDLVKFSFTEEEKQTQLEWEHSKEFEYKGEMYDVVKTEVHGDTTYYWCWWDHEETKLNKQLDQLVAYALGNNPQRRESENRLLKFLESLYVEDDNSESNIALLSVNEMYLFKSIFYRSVFIQLSVPPPEEIA